MLFAALMDRIGRGVSEKFGVDSICSKAWLAQLCNGTDSLRRLLIAWQNWNSPYLIATVSVAFLLPCLAPRWPSLPLSFSIRPPTVDRGSKLLYWNICNFADAKREWVRLYRRNGRNGRQPWIPSALLSYVQYRLTRRTWGAPAHASQNWAISSSQPVGGKTCAPVVIIMDLAQSLVAWHASAHHPHGIPLSFWTGWLPSPSFPRSPLTTTNRNLYVSSRRADGVST